MLSSKDKSITIAMVYGSPINEDSLRFPYQLHKPTEYKKIPLLISSSQNIAMAEQKPVAGAKPTRSQSY
jgi:hypothetical protein